MLQLHSLTISETSVRAAITIVADDKSPHAEIVAYLLCSLAQQLPIVQDAGLIIEQANIDLIKSRVIGTVHETKVQHYTIEFIKNPALAYGGSLDFSIAGQAESVTGSSKGYLHTDGF